jgi:hypothetical protein
MKIDDKTMTLTHKVKVDIVENVDEMILSTIHRIGGDIYQHITIDKTQVLKALSNFKKQAVVVDRRPLSDDTDGYVVVRYKCPSCRETLLIDDYNNGRLIGPVKSRPKFCQHCGQSLEWSD